MDDTNDSAAKLTRLPRRKLTGGQPVQDTKPDPTSRIIVSISPFRCRVWEMHDRLEDYITAESCCTEIGSFEAHGQLVPALGRPVRGDPDYDLEVVCGARRLFVARHLGALLQVEIREMSDREALVALDIENRHRKDTSPYERGVTYQ